MNEQNQRWGPSKLPPPFPCIAFYSNWLQFTVPSISFPDTFCIHIFPIQWTMFPYWLLLAWDFLRTDVPRACCWKSSDSKFLQLSTLPFSAPSPLTLTTVYTQVMNNFILWKTPNFFLKWCFFSFLMYCVYWMNHYFLLYKPTKILYIYMCVCVCVCVCVCKED